jgi:hypothetical protein
MIYANEGAGTSGTIYYSGGLAPSEEVVHAPFRN